MFLIARNPKIARRSGFVCAYHSEGGTLRRRGVGPGAIEGALDDGERSAGSKAEAGRL